MSDKPYFDFSSYPDNELSNWQKLYIDFIKKNTVDEATECYLICVDDDEIPELVIIRGCMADGSVIATVYNDKLSSLELWPDGLNYASRKNLLVDSGGRMGDFYDSVYKIKKGKFVIIGKGTYGIEDESVYDMIDDYENLEKYYVYHWNGAKVSKKEYYDNFNDILTDTICINDIPGGTSSKKMIKKLKNNNFTRYPYSS